MHLAPLLGERDRTELQVVRPIRLRSTGSYSTDHKTHVRVDLWASITSMLIACSV